MKTKKIKNIESAKNPFNPVLQKYEFEQYEKYTRFINSVEFDDSNWDDETATEWLEDDAETVYLTDKISARINYRMRFTCEYQYAHNYDSKADNFFEIVKCENRKDLQTICKIIGNGCIKSMVRNSGDGYILDLRDGKKPHDLEDIYAVAMSELNKCIAVHESGPAVDKFIDLNENQKRRTRRRNVTAWNHIENESDFEMKEKPAYKWIRSAVYAYIQSMRGVRVPVVERKKVPVKNKKTGKIEMVEKVFYNSVYLTHYSTDEMSDETYYRMKANAVNCDENGAGVNEHIARLAKRMKAEKVLTDMQAKIIAMKESGDSYRTIAGALGKHESTVRESYKAGWKRLKKWLIENGYKINVER